MSMKILIALGILLMLSTVVSANVQISQVLYDPNITQSGGEAVELYNPDNFNVNISGYYLKTEASTKDATIPQNTIIKANSYYLIADAGFSTNKDNPTWPNADYEEAITLANTDAGVALIDPSGDIIDAVGWGNPANINAGLFEGTPSNHVAKGKGLLRINQTNDNHRDFIEVTPQFKNSNSESGGLGGSANFSAKIAFTVTVTNPLSRMTSFHLEDDDMTKNGTQIVPYPKIRRNVFVNITANNDNGVGYIGNIVIGFNGTNYTFVKSRDINATDAAYGAAIPLDFFKDPGNYNISIFFVNNTENKYENKQFEYAKLIAYEVDASSLKCNAKVGQKCSVLGDMNMSSDGKTTIRNIGNIKLDFEIFGKNLENGAEKIDVSNIKYSFGNSALKSLSKTPAKNQVSLRNDQLSLVGLNFELEIPKGSKSGEYVSEIYLNGAVTG